MSLTAGKFVARHTLRLGGDTYRAGDTIPGSAFSSDAQARRYLKNRHVDVSDVGWTPDIDTVATLDQVDHADGYFGADSPIAELFRFTPTRTGSFIFYGPDVNSEDFDNEGVEIIALPADGPLPPTAGGYEDFAYSDNYSGRYSEMYTVTEEGGNGELIVGQEYVVYAGTYVDTDAGKEVDFGAYYRSAMRTTDLGHGMPSEAEILMAQGYSMAEVISGYRSEGYYGSRADALDVGGNLHDTTKSLILGDGNMLHGSALVVAGRNNKVKSEHNDSFGIVGVENRIFGRSLNGNLIIGHYNAADTPEGGVIMAGDRGFLPDGWGAAHVQAARGASVNVRGAHQVVNAILKKDTVDASLMVADPDPFSRESPTLPAGALVYLDIDVLLWNTTADNGRVQNVKAIWNSIGQTDPANGTMTQIGATTTIHTINGSGETISSIGKSAGRFALTVSAGVTHATAKVTMIQIAETSPQFETLKTAADALRILPA